MQIYAYNFAIDVFGSSAFNMTHKAWFESMQRNCRENIYRASESDLNLLEMPKLKQKFVQTTQSLKEMFEGTKFAGYASNDALNFVLEPRQISFEQFLDIAYMVQTRRMQLGSKQAMIPIFDFINNAETEQKANARFFNNQSHVGFLATKDIPNGTEIRWNYRGNQRTNPDEIFFIWQYITDEVDVLFAEDEAAFVEILNANASSSFEKLGRLVEYIDSTLDSIKSTTTMDSIFMKKKLLSDLQNKLIKVHVQRKHILRRQKRLLQRKIAFRRLLNLLGF